MKRTIGFVIFDGFQLLDLAGPLGVFEVGHWANGRKGYDLSIVANRAGRITSSSGATVDAVDLKSAKAIDTLIVVGGAGTFDAMKDPVILDFLRRRGPKLRRCCSVCTGSMILAAAGLLEGRQATTHWRQAHLFSRMFPGVTLKSDAIHIQDGSYWTSAGVTAGIDLALALVQDDLGAEISKTAAQELVVYHRRPGGQSQFSALLSLNQPEGRFAPLLAWIRENLARALTVEELAERAAMSPRNFSRAFLEEIGVTPAKTVERLRLEAARVQIEGTSETLSVIASACGFGDPDRMRRAFLRVTGQTPQSLRRQADAA